MIDEINLIILSKKEPLDLDFDLVVVSPPLSVSRLDSLCLFKANSPALLSFSNCFWVNLLSAMSVVNVEERNLLITLILMITIKS